MRRSSLRRLAGLSTLALLAGWGCGSPPGTREAMKLPAVSNLRLAAGPLMDHVEPTEEPPEWLNQERVEDGVLYGIGMQPEATSPEQDLYLAMLDARRSVIGWLEKRGARVEAPGGLVPPLAIDESGIGFERLAHDTENGRWYALARLDLRAETADAARQVEELNQRLAADHVAVIDDRTERGARMRAALSVLYSLDRRAQWMTLYERLGEQALATPEGLETTLLAERARDVLGQHTVRIVLEGRPVPGLYETVSGAIGEVYLRADDLGEGLVAVRLEESQSFSHGWPYLQVDGEVQISIAGPGARLRTIPLHVVSSGVDEDEARFRAAHDVNLEVLRILRQELAELGS